MTRNFFQTIFFSLMFFSCVVVAGTHGILEGKIFDKNTNEPLLSVTIQILGTTIGGVSNADGYFQIYNIRAGVYDVQFSILGYQTVLMKKVTIESDLRTRVDVALEQSAVELGVVEITSQKPLIQKDQPATAFSISEVKIDKLPISNFTEIISLQPGVTFEGNVRGGKTNEVLYLVDGVPVQDVIAGGLGAELPKSAIGGMSIYTGGFEAEYGNAMSAIVNVITRSGDNNHKFTFRFEKDNWIPSRWNKQVDQYNEAELTASGPILRSKLFYLTALTARLNNTRWWQDMQNFFPSFNTQQYSGMTKFDYTLSQAIRVGFQGLYSYDQWYDYEYSWRYNLDGLPQRSKISLRGTLTWVHTISDRSAYTLSVSRYYLRNRIGEGLKQNIDIEPYQYDIFLRYIIDGKKNWWASTQQLVQTIKGDFSSQIDDAQFFKTGFEVNLYDIFNDIVKFDPQRTYYGKTLENAPLLNYSTQYEYLPRSGSVFIQDKIRFSLDGSVLSLGLRWDFLDPRAERPIVENIPKTSQEFEQKIVGSAPAKLKHQLSPRIAFAAPMGVNSMFFVNFGQYFQFPLFDYLYSGITPAQIQSGSRSVLTGNPDLAPEKTIAWEIGYKYAVNQNYVGSLTYFKKNIKNQIDSKTLIPFDSKSAGDYGFAQYVNNAEAEASGLEFIISRERDEKFSGSLSYTYMFTEGTSELANQSINLAQWGFPIKATSFPLSWDQRHAVKLDLEGMLWYDIFANMVVWYNSPKPYTYFPTRDGFVPIDSTKDFVPNNARMRNVVFANLKFSREFKFMKPPFERLVLYVDVRNLFNTKNVKWIDSNGRIGGELGDPAAYYDFRRVRAGFTIDF